MLRSTCRIVDSLGSDKGDYRHVTETSAAAQRIILLTKGAGLEYITRQMSPPKVIEISNGYRGAVIVCTEADGVTHSWTVTDDAILGSGIITFDGTETLDHNTYRRIGNQWHSYTPEGGLQKVSDEIATHLDLVEQTAATYKSSGPVQ
jgi:hypothetical protein